MAVRPGTNWTADDLDYIGRPREDRFDSWGTAEVLNEYKERISVGQPMDGISELGGLHRQLLQESDFHAVGRSLLKKLTPEEENEKLCFDATGLPSDIKALLLGLEEVGLECSNLKSTIKLAADDEDALKWISCNWESLLDVSVDDALEHAEYGLDEDQVEDEDDFASSEHGEELISYRLPRDSYTLVEFFRKSRYKEAAERRKNHLGWRLQSIQKCCSCEELERELDRIRDAYTEDRQLLQLWSSEQKAAERKEYLRSLHSRREKLEVMRNLGLTDEVLDFEMIRRKVWFCFDREPSEKKVVKQVQPVRAGWVDRIDKKTGRLTDECFLKPEECDDIVKKHWGSDPRNVVLEKVATPGSLWDSSRSWDLCELNHTRAQWERIYAYLWSKIEDHIIWSINDIRQAEQANRVCAYVRQFQFRLDPERLAEAILKKAAKVQTEAGRNVIRMLLASCQYQLSKKQVKEIVREMNRRRK